MIVNVLAFGFKFGPPREAELLFDVRFLRNPNYEPLLQPRTGMDAEVGIYVEADPVFKPFLERLFALLELLLPAYAQSGRRRLTIGIGCTGGHHRSVYVARRVIEHFEERALGNISFNLELRDATK